MSNSTKNIFQCVGMPEGVKLGCVGGDLSSQGCQKWLNGPKQYRQEKKNNIGKNITISTSCNDFDKCNVSHLANFLNGIKDANFGCCSTINLFPYFWKKKKREEIQIPMVPAELKFLLQMLLPTCPLVKEYAKQQQDYVFEGKFIEQDSYYSA